MIIILMKKLIVINYLITVILIKVPSMIKRLFEQPFKFQQFVRPLFLIEHHIFEPMMANE